MSLIRYASTLGDRFVRPLAFFTEDAAVKYAESVRETLGDLPGMGSMRVEVLADSGDWIPIWPVQGKP